MKCPNKKNSRFILSILIMAGLIMGLFATGGGPAFAYSPSGWEKVGASRISTAAAAYVSLQVDNGIPYVAYRDDANGYKGKVKKFNGTVWEDVGDDGFSDAPANFISFQVNNGTPYVAFQDTANDNKVRVKKYHESLWEDIGGTDISAGKVDDISLYVDRDNDTLYIAYRDFANGYKPAVKNITERHGRIWILPALPRSVGNMLLCMWIMV